MGIDMKIKKLLIIAICILCFPLVVLAVEGNSGVVSTSNRVGEFSIGKMIFSNLSFTTFVNYNSTIYGGYEINGILHNYYAKNVEIEVILTLYDNNENVLDVITSNEEVLANNDFYYNVGSEINPTTKKYSIDSVKFYNVLIKILTDVSEKKETKKNNNYEIEEFKTNILVNLDNKVNYDENISIKFKNDMPYFYRKIFTNNRVLYYNNQLAKLSGISSSEKLTTSLEKGYRILKLSNDVGYSDMRNFNLKYTYDLGEDYSKKKDKLYINVIDNTFDVVINKINFEIQLPEEFNDENIKFVSLKEDVTKNINFEVIGNKITGSLDNLEENKNLGLLIDLDEGYFKKSTSIFDKSMYLLIFGPTFGMIGALLLTLFLLRSKKVSKEIKLEKIMKLNSLEMSYIYNEKINNKDITCLLVELANDGYLKIKETKNASFEIIKIKDYDGADEIKKKLLECLFKNSEVINEEQLYENDENIIEQVNKCLVELSSSLRNNYFNKYIYLPILAIFTFLIINFKPLLMYDEDMVALGTILAVGCLIIFIIVLFSKYKMIEKILAILCISIFLIGDLYIYIGPALLIHPFYLFSYIIGSIIVGVLIYLYRIVPKRTFKADIEMANIRRFKLKLEKSSLSILNKSFKINDSYMKMWPYANILGLSQSYANKINESVILPEWFLFADVNSQNFNAKLNDVVSRITYALSNCNK